MYAYWLKHLQDRGGLGPRAADIASACGTTLYAAREAIRRYRRGRVPAEYTAGLSAKSVRNVHVVMRRALNDAVLWGYLYLNPAANAVVPRDRRARQRNRERAVWTPEELGRWLLVALEDRYGGMWCLMTTTGQRRSELAGVSRDRLDLQKKTLRVEDTRVVVRGRAVDSDGKSAAGWRIVSLEDFTVFHLGRYIAMIDAEREAFGDDYPDHGYLMVSPEGRRLHPDTITARFNRLVDKAGVPRIRLQDVRHSYATIALDANQAVKKVSGRIGHADTSITEQIYVHPSNRTEGDDQQLADELGELIKQAVEAASKALGTDLDTDRPSEQDTQSDCETGTDGDNDQPEAV